jgi:sn-glycerol 3-phosphate transport system ATP-binding protein
MNAGRMEQFGTPEQVYQTPATTFVAGFIGSPPMNLLRGRAEGHRFVVGAQTLPLPLPAPRDGELILGLRPEHVVWGEGAWALQVDVVETLGAERLVYARIGDALFTVRIDGTLPPPPPGARVPLGFSAERAHWFDAASGQRL